MSGIIHDSPGLNSRDFVLTNLHVSHEIEPEVCTTLCPACCGAKRDNYCKDIKFQIEILLPKQRCVPNSPCDSCVRQRNVKV